MGSTAEQVPAAAAPTPEIVGNAFVHQYYQILHNQAEHVHRFYQNSSKLGRPDENGAMTITTTMNDINAKILSLNYDEFSAEIKTVDAQESYQGGVLVLVTGFLTGKDNITRNFTQTFFLAPQDKNGYFVLNDTFRYVEPVKDHGGERNLESVIEAPVAPDEDLSIAHENNVSQQISESPIGTNEEEVYVSAENGNVPVLEEEAAVPEVIDEVDDISHKFVSEPVTKVENTPKMSYASMLKVPAALPIQSPPPKRIVPKSSEPKAKPAPAVEAETVVNAKTVDYKNYQEEDGHSIYIKGLPMNATPALLEAEFKQYGAIKRNGIQVRSNKDFCFGFVEFEVATAVQKAMEASPFTIDGCQAFVEEKRSSSRVNNRSRFLAGRGNGFRSEGGRGGNYGGGRGGYGRNEFNNRSEFGNRGYRTGGFSNRGGDGYQRSDSGNGRVNRSGASTFNASAKSVAQSVPASA